MNIETREQILQSCADWLRDAKLKKKFMFIEISNPIEFLKTRYVKVEDIKISLIDMMQNDLKTVNKNKFHKLMMELK